MAIISRVVCPHEMDRLEKKSSCATGAIDQLQPVAPSLQ